MAKKITDETLKFNIVVNGNEGQKEFNKLERANKKIAQSTQELDKELRKLSRSKKKNAKAIAQVTEKLAANKKQLSTNETAMGKLRKEVGLNNLAMTQLRKESKRLGKQMDGITPGTEQWQDWNKELQAVTGRMAELKTEMKSVEKVVEKQVPTFDTARNSFSQFKDSLMSGDYKGAKAGLKGITSGLKGAAKAGISFALTPVGMLLTGLAGIVAVTKKWADYNKVAGEANIVTSNITKLTGEQLDYARVRAQALSDTFKNTGFEENLETAKVLVNEFGISYKEAFDEIERSNVRGADANKEFTASAKEFSSIQAKAGFTVRDTMNLINTSYDKGLHNDKLIDSIHEVDTALKEGEKSAKEALEGAFGEKFTTKLFKGVKDGTITTKDALALMSKEADKAQLNNQQYAKLTADIFKSAGEDIGGAKKVLETFNEALNKQEKALTPVQKETKRLADSHRDLLLAQDEALKSDSYAKFSNDVTITWNKLKAFFYKSISYIVGLFQNWELARKLLISNLMLGFAMIPKRFGAVKTAIIEGVKGILGAFVHLGDAWGDIKKLNFSGAKKHFGEFKNAVVDSTSKAKEGVSAVNSEIEAMQKSMNEAIVLDFKTSKQAAGEIAPPKTPSGAGSNQGVSPEQKAKNKAALDAMRKLQEEILKLEEDARLKKLSAEEQELEQIRAKYATLLDEAKKYREQSGVATEEEATLEALRDEELKSKKLEQETAFEEEKQKIKDQYGLITLEEKQQAEFTQLKSLFEKKLLSEAEYLQAVYALKAAHKAEADLIASEKEEEEYQVKFEAGLVRDEEMFAHDLQKYREHLEAKKMSEEDIEKAITKMKLQHMEQRIQKASQFVQAAGGLISGLKQLELSKIKDVTKREGESEEDFLKRKEANEQKKNKINKKYAKLELAMTVGKVIANTATGVMRAFSDMGPIAGAVMAALIAATGVVQIANAKAQYNKVTGHEKGLYKDKVNVTRTDGKKFNARVGGSTKTGVVTEPTYFQDYLTGEAGPEMVIDNKTFKNLDPSVIEHIYNVRDGVSGYESGKYSNDNAPVSSEGTSSIDKDNEMQTMMYDVIVKLSTQLDKPIKADATFKNPYEAAENIKLHNDELKESNDNGTLAT